MNPIVLISAVSYFVLLALSVYAVEERSRERKAVIKRYLSR